MSSALRPASSTSTRSIRSPARADNPIDHSRRLRRGRAAGAPQDHRGDRRQRAAPERSQAPPPGIHPDRYAQHPLHLRRRVRRTGGDRSANASARQSPMGFGGLEDETEEIDELCCHHMNHDDLLKYGLIPEFVGRLPVAVALDPLSREELMRILVEPQECGRQAVSEVLRARQCRTGLHAGRARSHRAARPSNARPALAACARPSRKCCST